MRFIHRNFLRIDDHVPARGPAASNAASLTSSAARRDSAASCPARALAADPVVLLMDEPFAALDAQTREFMQSELLKIWAKAKKTVVFITHQINEAIFLADRVAVLSSRPGRLKKVFDVPFDRPRTLALKRDPRFLELEDEIWKLIEEESDRMGMVVEETV